MLGEGVVPASGLGGLLLGGVPALVWGVSAPGDTCLWSGGCLLLGGTCLCLGGVSQHAMGQTSPVNIMTDRCKNITLPQTLFAAGKNLRDLQTLNKLTLNRTRIKVIKAVKMDFFYKNFIQNEELVCDARFVIVRRNMIMTIETIEPAIT